MTHLTLMTVLVELLPPIIVTLAYFTLMRNRHNNYMEAFILLMYVKALTFFIVNIYLMNPLQAEPFNAEVDTETFLYILFTDFMFQFVYSL